MDHHRSSRRQLFGDREFSNALRVELVRLKLETHQPAIEPVSAMRRERKFSPQRQAGKTRLIT